MCYAAIPGTCLEQVQSFRYFRYVVNQSGTDDADIKTKVMQDREVASM